MNNYSITSAKRLATCDPRLQDVFYEVLKVVDHTVLEGHRGKGEQNEYFRTGKSQIEWPNGTHNSLPSKGIDAAPYPINWKDRERATLFAGFVMGVAASKGIKIRWGGDWDRDWKVKDNNFDDLWHFEIEE